VIVYIGQFFESYKSSTTCWATFCYGKSCILFWTKTGLGYTLGDFFTNSSGHPGPRPQNESKVEGDNVDSKLVHDM
jgi:hypothetical protein